MTNSATLTVNKACHRRAGQLEPDVRRLGQSGDSDDDPERVDGELHVQRFGDGSDRCRQLHGGGTINDANYQGSATGTMVIGKATGSIVLGSLSQTYDGSAKAATATTTPSGLTVSFTYNGSATVPTSAGSYTVVGTINDANYQGSATGTMVIEQGDELDFAGQPEPDVRRFGQGGHGDHDPERVGSDVHLQRFSHGSDRRR